MVPASSHSLSCYVVESAEGSENVEDLHRPCCGLCVDGIWTGRFLGIVYRHICMEDSYSVCHFADDGDGNCLTGLIVNTKVVTIGGVLGALLSLGCFYMPGIDQILFFALAFVFMMVIPGTLHEQCGEASQTIKEEDDICLKN